MKWTKEKPIKDGPVVCHICNCGAHESLGMDALLAVGFGDVTVTRDGERIYSEIGQTRKAQQGHEEAYWTAATAEKIASEDPDHDWRITFFGPLWGGTYQRHGENHWVLIEKDNGFA